MHLYMNNVSSVLTLSFLTMSSHNTPECRHLWQGVWNSEQVPGKAVGFLTSRHKIIGLVPALWTLGAVLKLTSLLFPRPLRKQRLLRWAGHSLVGIAWQVCHLWAVRAVNITKLLSRKLCKESLMFPEEFPACWQAQACVNASLTIYELSSSAAVKSCHFSPGCVEPVCPECQAMKLRLIQKEGLVKDIVEKVRDHCLFQL
jgi:hypothetical protein